MPTTWNASDKTANITLSNGNLTATQANVGQNGGARSVDCLTTGKYYWECTYTTTSNIETGAGITKAATALNTGTVLGNCIMCRDGWLRVDGSSTVNFGAAVVNGTVVCLALDIDNKLFWARVGAAGNWNNNAAYSPGGTGGASIPGYGFATAAFAAVSLGAQNDTITANFGATAFSGVVPSGFTSGFPSPGASTNAALTQVAIEQWATPPTPRLQLTQAAIEQWAAVSTSNPLMAVTQIALEQWASVALASGAQTRVWIMA